MAKLDRLLSLVNALNETSDGLTLDEMALSIGADRRTAERLRDVIRLHFDLEELPDERRKRFRIVGSLRRVFTRPSAAEIAALEEAADAARRSGSAQTHLLDNLVSKVKAALDDREKRRLDPDLEPLARLQRRFVPAGPALETDPEALAQVQGAIMAGSCVEFEYLKEGSTDRRWRRVVPVGLIHGPVTYLIGQIPGRDIEPVPYRLDRMSEVRISNLPGCAADDWNLDTWMRQSFGIWREDGHDIVLRVAPEMAERARNWRFHPQQQIEDDGGEMVVRFHSGGLRELAEHLFTWGDAVRIEAPEELRVVMRQRLKACEEALDHS
ncbi:MAG: WYL domain-containing protein [Novosphingobium sp.]|uniref:helix-turn-helix transcriptional regulator n=1 Tax=Novosphingobium sp. TaxID=1874826 RepID=UPI002621E4C9|nr:WYL domain-containing protein [Novosphingobium sp.]MCP5385464.1 WYL domain-containing protein [Novosphingobium sp.]